MSKKIIYDGINFEVDENGALQRMWNDKKAQKIFIPNEFPDGTVISSIAPRFCYGNYGTVQISSKICTIQERAFKASDVKKVIWPTGCTTIPKNCFEDSEITEILNIDDVLNIEFRAFAYCKIQDITWPTKCTTIPRYCFEQCLGLKEIKNTDNVLQIEEGAFKHAGLFDFKWPRKCTEIPQRCFEHSYLENITDIEDVTKIGAWAFAYTCIKSITVPQKVRAIPTETFRYCRSLVEVNLHDEISRIGESAFSTSGIRALKWPAKSKTIPKHCFFMCERLEKLSGISGVKAIGYGAFVKCIRLTEFKWPNGCKEVKDDCFYNCLALNKINLPDTVTNIGTAAFAFCGVREIRWPSACSTIPNRCFDSSALKSITNISHVTTIGESAFENSLLEELDLSDTHAVEIGDYALGSAIREIKVSLPYYMERNDCERLFRTKA